MQNSFRWYGPNDPVKLTDIRQANAEYIVTSLHHIPYGEKWSKNNIKKRKDYIDKYNNSYNINLKWNVVESIPVHNDIKLRHKNFIFSKAAPTANIFILRSFNMLVHHLVLLTYKIGCDTKQCHITA